MERKLSNLCEHLGIRIATVQHLCELFYIDFQEQTIDDKKYLYGSSLLSEKFFEFLIINKDFLKQFEIDYYSDKTPQLISEKIKKDINLVTNYLLKNHPNFFKDGIFVESKYGYPLRYVSSYKVDLELGENYDFLNISEFVLNSKTDKNHYLFYTADDVIGYNDIKSIVAEQLESINNIDERSIWGLNNPCGIILYGPPGCGKTLWAKQICKMIDYQFEEIPRSIFGSIYVDGAMMNLKKKLEEFDNKSKTLIFFDEFDSIASSRFLDTNNNESSKVVNTLLQEIPKLIKNQNIIIAATNFINQIDPAVIRPGRFDLKIPIFPPNINERIDIICFNLFEGLTSNSPLLRILKYNHADKYEFWVELASSMYLFSNSMIVDFTQLLKRRIKSLFTEKKDYNIEISKAALFNMLNEIKSKITLKDIEVYVKFFEEVKLSGMYLYEERLSQLCNELNIVLETSKKSRRRVGF